VVSWALKAPTVASSGNFDYDASVSRNLGWVSSNEQAKLRQTRIAIEGLGGVGGSHLLTLARLGVGKFNISDFDQFGIHNLNRQAGAFVSSLGRPKVDVMTELAKDINPDIDIARFPKGVTEDNVDDFLKNADIYVDGIDFFAMDARRLLFAACRVRGIPAITAAPLGMGVSLLYFPPDGMSLEDYFRLEGCDRNEQFARFIAGLSPAMLQRRYLVVPESVDFNERRGPSTVMACELCAGVMGTAVLKIALGRRPPRAVPWAMQFDAYRQRLAFTWRPFGNANPVQQVLLMLIRPKLRVSPPA